MTMTKKVKEVDILRVYASSLDCPHCGSAQDGWLIDPRDKEHECDECGKTYKVPADVRIDF